MFHSPLRASDAGRREAASAAVTAILHPAHGHKARKDRARRIVTSGFDDFYVQAFFGLYLRELDRDELQAGNFSGAVTTISDLYRFYRAQRDDARQTVSLNQSRLSSLLLALRYLRRFGAPSIHHEHGATA